VVDADSHVIEPPDAWATHLPAAWRDRAPSLVTEDGADWLVLDDARFFNYPMVGGLARQEPGLPDAGGPPRGTWREALVPGAYEVAPRLADMDRDGVDAAVVYPTVGMGLFGLADHELARGLAQAYNRWIAGYVAGCPSRLLGVGVVVPGEAAEMVADMAQCRELGLVQVLLPLATDQSGFADPRWEPVFEFADSTGLLLACHAFTGRPKGRRPRSDTLVEALVDRTAAIERAVVELVFGGVFDRFADLRFVSVENEAGWAAGLIERADVSFRRGRRSGEGFAGCQTLPSELCRDHAFFTFMRDRAAIDARRVIGEQNILWSTDYPHNSSTWPHSLEVLDTQLRPEISDEDVAAVVGGNAARLYGLDEAVPAAGGPRG
jgi:predicted TIM-barrel fold metal-dependent hydrolase